MAFTMVVTDDGRRRPGAVCDSCSEIVGPRALVFWGQQVESLGLDGEPPMPFTSLSSFPPWTAAVVCGHGCAAEIAGEHGLEALFVSVEEYIAWYVLANDIDVAAVARRGIERDQGGREDQAA